jgi:FkbM family methyltransferase
MEKYIVIDVGCFKGLKSLFIAQQNPSGAVVYAFDPLFNSEIAPKFKTKIKELGLSNYYVHGQAVSDYDGESKFYLANALKFSSLLPFAANSQNTKFWRPKIIQKLKIKEAKDVNVITLKTFMTQKALDKIDYLKIDARGSGLLVLKGLGEKISFVDRGVVESSALNKNEVLYKDQANYNSIVEFLENNNFEITDVKTKDPKRNMVDIYFKRKK